MKKLLLATVLLGVMFSVSACSGKKNTVSDEGSELTVAPEVTQAAAKENVNDNPVTDKNGEYEKVQYGIHELYFPATKESDQIKGVQYLYAAYFDYDVRNMSEYRAINRPEGTCSVDGNAQLRFYAAALPDTVAVTEGMGITRTGIKDTKNEYFKVRVAEAYKRVNAGYTGYGGDDRNEKVKTELNHVDVQAVSFALYEDFYEAIPNLTINVYGISDSTWNKYLPEDDVYSYNDVEAMKSALAENDYSDCDKLASREIDKSGVYYMDYSEYNSDNRYKQLLIVAEFDEMPADYAVVINDDMNYNISNTEQYAKWKESNKDKFIE